MSRVAKLCVVLATGLATLAACRSPATQPSSAQASIASAEDEEKRSQVTRNAARQADEGGRRYSRTTLAGVHIENREVWDYKDAAYDPVTGQTVRSLQIFFVNRQVDSVNFSY